MSNIQNSPQTPNRPKRPVVEVNDQRAGRTNLIIAAVASIVSVGLHAVLILLLMQLDLGGAKADTKGIETTDTKVEEEVEPELDLTQLEIGIEPKVDQNIDELRIEEVTVPGEVVKQESIGIENAPDTVMKNIPNPVGFGQGTGAAIKMPDAGTASMFGDIGGAMGKMTAGGFNGRSGATRKALVYADGGNDKSEAAVAAALRWLALHQHKDGYWSLHNFNTFARTHPLPAGRKFKCNCTPESTRVDNIAATGFGLLPFLGAGQTHRPTPDAKVDYSKAVLAGLDYLIAVQTKTGKKRGHFGGQNLYSHGLCTIAMCEAYGMTSHRKLRESAQMALDFITRAQLGDGGWRYSMTSREGDLSVAGWHLMALKSGQMSGLSVPASTLKKAQRFLDDCETPNGGFSYTARSGRATHTMTSVGLLCRQYMGVNPRNPKLLKGLQILKRPGVAPGKTHSMYYEYYATQVFHHMGGESWQYWNLGPDGKGTNGFRDQLIKRQFIDQDGKKVHQTGSWGKRGGHDDGRLMVTSLSALMLEVYYRHLPLYRRDLGVTKMQDE